MSIPFCRYVTYTQRNCIDAHLPEDCVNMILGYFHETYRQTWQDKMSNVHKDIRYMHNLTYKERQSLTTELDKLPILKMSNPTLSLREILHLFVNSLPNDMTIHAFTQYCKNVIGNRNAESTS